VRKLDLDGVARWVESLDSLLDQLERPASRLILESADAQVSHALVWLAFRRIRLAPPRQRMGEVRRALGDGGYLHAWTEHLDPNTGPMTQRNRRWLAAIVRVVEDEVRKLES